MAAGGHPVYDDALPALFAQDGSSQNYIQASASEQSSCVASFVLHALESASGAPLPEPTHNQATEDHGLCSTRLKKLAMMGRHLDRESQNVV